MCSLKITKLPKACCHLFITIPLLISLQPLSANATLLGRLNNYYGDPKQAIPTNKISLLLKKQELLEKKAKLGDPTDDNKKELDSLGVQLKRIEKLLELHMKVEAGIDAAQQAEKEATSAAGAGKETAQAKVSSSLTALAQAKKELEDAENIERSKLIVDETTYGVHEGLGAATIINSDKNASIALNVYRFNLIVGTNDNSGYKSAPMYIFLKKSLDSKVNKDTVTDDLLDNEFGGTVHIKISKGSKELSGWKIISFDKADDPKLKNYGSKWVFDAGVKLIEAPAIPVAGATETTTTWIGAGYIGAGLNFELPIFSPNNNGGSDSQQFIAPGTKPAGGLAIGFGAYRNFVGANQFDNTKFSRPVPKAFNSYALLLEMQITSLLSVKGTRVITRGTPLGGYTSFQIGYKFD